MSLLSQHECCICGGYTGWAGERVRRNPLRSYTACKCDEQAQLTETLPDPFPNEMRKVA